MLDIARLERIQLTRRPLAQRITGSILLPNYYFLPGIQVEFEGMERVPDEPVIFAMNHTDRYNYFPFQLTMWRRHDRFTATWVKGKYYENAFIGAFMEWTNQLPTVSRGYLITRDFFSVTNRTPTDAEYGLLRGWVDEEFRIGGSEGGAPAPDGLEALPQELFERPRNVIGHPFEPERVSYACYINEVYARMMEHFVKLNRLAIDTGLDLLIFPEGTRSVQLSRGHIGLGEVALYLKRTIVPVGCSGSHRLYPGGSPFARRGRVVYRFGDPISWADMKEFDPDEPFEPFTRDAEIRHRDRFQGLVDRIMDRINELVDPEHRYADGRKSRGVAGSDRFI